MLELIHRRPSLEVSIILALITIPPMIAAALASPAAAQRAPAPAPQPAVPPSDYATNRTKRLLGDPASLRAARSEARYLLQRTQPETGDVIYDLSVPITVRGKHWGCARIGYRRAE